jgi:endonuclease/exonuclease/phosphatase family metal-dependent hydrolase
MQKVEEARQKAQDSLERSRRIFRLVSRSSLSRSSLAARLLICSFCLLLSAFLLLPSSSGQSGKQRSDGSANLLETGAAVVASAKPAPSSQGSAPVEIKIVSYNIRWRGGEDLRRLTERLRDDEEIGRADIIGLQEVDRNRKRTDNVNTARQMAEALKMNYVWAAPPHERGDKEEPTGVAILSPHPLTDVVRIVLPHEGPGERRRAAVGATVRIGERDVRVYSVHAETRIKMEKKMEQLGAALEDLKRYPQIKHAVVLGDHNTIKDKDVRGARKLFTDAGFHTPFPDDRSTFKAAYILKFKLDWIWLRGFDPATAHGIAKRIEFSDHWPLWLKARLDTKKDAPAN